MKFKYKDKVIIINGFYRTNKGVLNCYDKNDNTYGVIFNDKSIGSIWIKEEDLILQ